MVNSAVILKFIDFINLQHFITIDDRTMVKSGSANVQICECRNRFKTRVRDKIKISIKL